MSEPYENTNGWNQWEKHVLITLERMEKNQDALKAEVSSLRQEVSSLKTKATVWGSLAALVVTTGVNFLIAFIK